MELLNRSAVIVKPLRPYLEWAKKDDAKELADSVFENLRSEPHVYLLPEHEDPTAQQEVLAESWPALFEAMLEGWVTDEGVLAQGPNAGDVPRVVRDSNVFDRSGPRQRHTPGADLTQEPRRSRPRERSRPSFRIGRDSGCWAPVLVA